MNIDSLLSQIRPILKLVGIALVIVAGLQLFNLVHINFGGDVTQNALVGLGLLHV
jgi:hypothetical protein